MTRPETAPPQPTWPRDLKVGGSRGGQFGCGAQRAARPGAKARPGHRVGQRRVSSPEPPAGAEMPPAASRGPKSSPGLVAATSHVPVLLLLLLSCCAGVCRGKPAPRLTGRPSARLALCPHFLPFILRFSHGTPQGLALDDRRRQAKGQMAPALAGAPPRAKQKPPGPAR